MPHTIAVGIYVFAANINGVAGELYVVASVIRCFDKYENIAHLSKEYYLLISIVDFGVEIHHIVLHAFCLLSHLKMAGWRMYDRITADSSPTSVEKPTERMAG